MDAGPLRNTAYNIILFGKFSTSGQIIELYQVEAWNIIFRKLNLKLADSITVPPEGTILCAW